MTYSKTRATKDNTTENLNANDLQPTTGASTERNDAKTIDLASMPTTGVDNVVIATTTPTKDRFAAPEYVNSSARLPRIQALRGENGPTECGYFITETEMAKAGWGHVNEEDLIVYEYNSGVRFV